MYVHEITSSNTSNRSPPPRILGPCLGAAPRRFVRVRKFGNYARERVEGWRPSNVYYTLRGRWWWNKLPRHVERWKGICQMILPIFADLPSDTFNFVLPRFSFLIFVTFSLTMRGDDQRGAEIKINDSRYLRPSTTNALFSCELALPRCGKRRRLKERGRRKQLYKCLRRS